MMRLLFFVTILSACSTTSKVTSIHELPALNANTIGVAIPIQVDTSDATFKDLDCSLLVKPKESAKVYVLDLIKGRDVIFAELPSGIYGFDSISCGVRQWNFISQHLANFEVYPGKISLVNGFSVFLSGRVNLTLEKNNRTQSRSSALSFFGRLSEENKARVVSSYTGKAIAASELEKSPRWKHWEQKNEQGELVKKPEKDWPSFRSCYAGEFDINPLWLGDLRLEAVFEKGNLLQVNAISSWNSYTEHFSQCIRDSLKDFHPKNLQHFSYELYL